MTPSDCSPKSVRLVPPPVAVAVLGVLVALLNAARLAASPGGLPQHTLMALIAVLKGWVQSLPRLLRSVAAT